MNETRNNKEVEVYQLLEAELMSGETLLAFTQSQTGGWITRKSHNLGLTAERLMIAPVKKDQLAGQILNIRRDAIDRMFSSGLWSSLKIKVEPDTLSMGCRKRTWKKRAREMVEVHTQTAVPNSATDVAATNQARLEQVQDLQELGLLNSAKAEMEKTLQADPGLQTDPEAAPIRTKLADQILALRVGAGFFGLTLLPLLVFGLLGAIQLNPIGIIILIITAINLWLAKTPWRWWGHQCPDVQPVGPGRRLPSGGPVLDSLWGSRDPRLKRRQHPSPHLDRGGDLRRRPFRAVDAGLRYGDCHRHD